MAHLEVPGDTAMQERARDAAGATVPGLRVLVVDDSQGARQVLAGALASNGFEASVAGSTEEALESLHRAPVDALVVDFSMPGPDGIAAELRTAGRRYVAQLAEGEVAALQAVKTQIEDLNGRGRPADLNTLFQAELGRRPLYDRGRA